MLTALKKYVWVAVLVLVIVLAAVMLLRGQGKETLPANEAETEYLTPVETAQVTRENLTSYLETVGDLKAGETASVAPKVSGRVSSVTVKLGDRVSQGQVLVTLDSTDVAFSVAQAESSVAVAQTNIGLSEQTVSDAELNFQRISQLFTGNAVSQSEYDRAESTLSNARLGLQVSQGQLRQAEINLANSRETLSYYTITSPISGEVATVNIHLGEMAGAQMSMINLVSLDPLKVNVNVSENIIGNLRQGAEFPITVPALGREVSGRISSISPTIDNVSKAFPVEILINNSQGDMKEGMVVKLRLLSGTANNVVALPTDAVLEKNGREYVFVLQDGNTVKEVTVNTGLMSDTMSEITEGLLEGQTVITTGNQLLKDGQKVSVSNGSQSTQEGTTHEDS